MRPRTIGLLLLFTLSVGSLAGAADRRADPSILTVMTFNAEFLWDGIDPEEGQANFPWKSAPDEAQEHMRRVAEVIIRANADVINLVEVENFDALKMFNDTFLAGRGYAPYLVKGTDTFTGQDVALLTRIDPEGNQITRDDRKGQSGQVLKSVSKNYVAVLPVGNLKVALIGLHLLAQPNNAARKLERQAQADAIRQIALDQREAGSSVIVLGDFNDYDPDVLDHINSTPISAVLRSVRSMDAEDGQDDLVNAAASVSQVDRFTAWWDQNDNDQVDAPQELTSIDHVLLSADLAGKIEAVQIDHAQNPPDVSDHYPVIVRLRMADPVTPSGGAPRLTSLLPNPAGNESQTEAVTFTNTGSSAASLVGWRLRDLAGKTWALDGIGTLQPGASRTLQRLGQPMSLNNDGDTVDLLNPAGLIVQSVTYGRVDEGELVTPVVP
jgi:exonuclease III